MKNIAALSVGALLLLAAGCAHKALKPGEVQQQVDTLCRNAADQEWREGAILPNLELFRLHGRAWIYRKTVFSIVNNVTNTKVISSTQDFESARAFVR